MARAKKVYEAGDLIEVVKSANGLSGSLNEVKPRRTSSDAVWNVSLPRTTRLFVVRHESGGGVQGFAGSVLCLYANGMVWVDARRVVLVIDKDGRT